MCSNSVSGNSSSSIGCGSGVSSSKCGTVGGGGSDISNSSSSSRCVIVVIVVEVVDIGCGSNCCDGGNVMVSLKYHQATSSSS